MIASDKEKTSALLRPHTDAVQGPTQLDRAWVPPTVTYINHERTDGKTTYTKGESIFNAALGPS